MFSRASRWTRQRRLWVHPRVFLSINLYVEALKINNGMQGWLRKYRAHLSVQIHRSKGIQRVRLSFLSQFPLKLNNQMLKPVESSESKPRHRLVYLRQTDFDICGFTVGCKDTVLRPGLDRQGVLCAEDCRLRVVRKLQTTE